MLSKPRLSKPKDAKALLAKLDERGITKAALDAGWIPQAYENGSGQSYDGWSYFTHFDCDLGVIRWKSGQEEGPKYAWPEGKPNQIKYYLLSKIDFLDQVLFVTAGEPDLLVLHTVAPQRNKLCWFGEGSIPADFVKDCIEWGFKTVVYYMDHDEAGLKAARMLARKFAEAKLDYPLAELDLRIAYIPAHLALNDGYDLNKLWIDCEFDVPTMARAIAGMDMHVEIVAEAAEAAKQARAQAEKRQTREKDDAPYVKRKYQVSSEAELAEIKRRCAIALADVLEHKHGDYYVCPLPHKDEDKDFILHVPDGPGDEPRLGGCQGKHAGAFNNHFVAWAENRGIDVTQIAREVAEEFRPFEDRAGGGAPDVASAPASSDEPLLFVSSDVALRNVDEWMEGTNLPDTELILCPYKPLRDLGGFARLWEPGHPVLLIGPAGMGKTALIERMSDNNRLNGCDDYMVGPEWTPEGYQYRAIVRYGGPSYIAQWEHVAYLRRKAKGIERPEFRPLNRAQLEDAKRIRKEIRQWPGKTYYPDIPDLGSVERIIEQIGQHAVALRETQDRRPTIVFWDYLQLTRGADDAWYQLEYDLGVIKDACRFYKLIPVFISQISKAVEKDFEAHGGLIMGSDGQGIGRAKPNLVVTISPVIVAGFRQEQAVLMVSKNNGGKAPAMIKVKTALFRHDWTDEVIPDKQEAGS